uniref:hypothetical protein n=1 Tax=Aeromonas media TaxID=651 RepID=UPI001F33C1B2
MDVAPVVIHVHKIIKMFTSSLPWHRDRPNVPGPHLGGRGGDDWIGLCDNAKPYVGRYKETSDAMYQELIRNELTEA